MAALHRRGLCSDIPRAIGRRYDQAADLTHRLQVAVLASNAFGTAYATSVRSDRIKPDKGEQRGATITQSYLIVFGRKPDAGELRHWSQWRYSLAELTRKHLAFIEGRTDEAKAVVRRAYWQVYGHAPNGAQKKEQWPSDWKAEMRQPRTYDDLVTEFARALARQARVRIFFWGRPDAPLKKGDVETFVSRARSDYYDNTKLWPKMTAGEALWTDVALSNDALHGAARTDYETYGAAGTAPREACFGGIGVGCKGRRSGSPAEGSRSPRSTGGRWATSGLDGVEQGGREHVDGTAVGGQIRPVSHARYRTDDRG